MIFTDHALFLVVSKILRTFGRCRRDKIGFHKRLTLKNNYMKTKLLLTFALLLTAVTGAWAQDPTWLQPGDIWEEGSKTLNVLSNPGNDAYQGITEIVNVNFAASVETIGDGCN